MYKKTIPTHMSCTWNRFGAQI